MNNLFRRPSVLLCSLVLTFVILSLPALAQKRIIRGEVIDENGEAIKDAQVQIIGMDIKREFKVKTNDKGVFLYMGIPQGVYNVIVRAKGYDPDFVSNVKSSLGETEANFTLHPGDETRKLPIEMSEEEQAKYRERLKQQAERSKVSGEVKAAFDQGLALAQQGNYEGALVEYQKAISMDPDQAYIQANMADALSRLGRDEEALAAYEKAIDLQPDDSAIYTNMGVVLGKLGRTEESQEAFTKAASLNPGMAAQNFYNLGATMVNEGRPEEAVQAFRQAIEADPNYAEAYFQLGICLSAQPENMKEAVEILGKYIEISDNPDQVEVAKQLIAALQP